MVEIGTAIDYKTLSWDGVLGNSAYLAKSRGMEVLKAREKVTLGLISQAKPGTSFNPIKPGYTPTLQEQHPYRGLSCTALIMSMRKEREDSAKHRKGVKVERIEPANLADVGLAVQA